MKRSAKSKPADRPFSGAALCLAAINRRWHSPCRCGAVARSPTGSPFHASDRTECQSGASDTRLEFLVPSSPVLMRGSLLKEATSNRTSKFAARRGCYTTNSEWPNT
jgi:hypothetical protein